MLNKYNPLHSNLFRKCLSLRKTKTDKVDSVVIAKMLLSEVDSKFNLKNTVRMLHKKS